MPDYNDLNEKAEAAIIAVIVAANTGIEEAQIFGSYSDDSKFKGAASISIQAQGGAEDGFGSGNERLTFAIKVASNGDRLIDTDTQEDEASGLSLTRHRATCAKVFDVLKQSSATLAAALSAAVTDFYVFPSIEIRRGPSRVNKRKFESEMSIEMTCAPSDIA